MDNAHMKSPFSQYLGLHLNVSYCWDFRNYLLGLLSGSHTCLPSFPLSCRGIVVKRPQVTFSHLLLFFPKLWSRSLSFFTLYFGSFSSPSPGSRILKSVILGYKKLQCSRASLLSRRFVVGISGTQGAKLDQPTENWSGKAPQFRGCMHSAWSCSPPGCVCLSLNKGPPLLAYVCTSSSSNEGGWEGGIVHLQASQFGEGSHGTALSAWTGGVSPKTGSVEGWFPKTYYTSFSDFSTGITQVSFTGNQFAGSTQTAVLEVEEEVNGSTFVPTKILLQGKPVWGEVAIHSIPQTCPVLYVLFPLPFCLARFLLIPEGLYQLLLPWKSSFLCIYLF